MKRQVVGALMAVLLTSSVSMAASAVAADANTAVSAYEKIDSGFALGMDTTLFLGAMAKNGLGYPTRFIGVSPSVGLEMRTFKNIPSADDVKRAAEKVLAKDPSIDTKELMTEINKQLHPGKFKYFQLGTEAIIVPKIGTGQMIPFSKDIDNVAYFDIGICFPWLLNMGFVFTF